jgi:hypothetical protein
MTKKTEAERQPLSIEAKASLLLKRKQLPDAVVLDNDIDLLLPLPSINRIKYNWAFLVHLSPVMCTRKARGVPIVIDFLLAR